MMLACISCNKVFTGELEEDILCPYCESDAIVPHDLYSTAPDEEVDENWQQQVDEYRRSQFEN